MPFLHANIGNNHLGYRISFIWIVSSIYCYVCIAILLSYKSWGLVFLLRSLECRSQEAGRQSAPRMKSPLTRRKARL